MVQVNLGLALFIYFLILSNFVFTYLGLCLISLRLMPNGKFLKLTLKNLNADWKCKDE